MAGDVITLVVPAAGSLEVETKVQNLRREPDGRVHMRGWTLDRNDISQPLLVFLVIPKKAVLMTSTGKTRDDVPKALNLALLNFKWVKRCGD